jgi:nitrite reductase/ring-hydroxylating ferredoxin subunit
MAIMRRERRASGNVGSTWPSAAAAPAARRDPVEEAGDESFPASDPPSWTLGPSTAAPTSAQDGPATPVEPVEPLALHEVEVMAASEIPEGAARGVEVEGREIALCKLGEEVFALSGACSYHPIPLRGAKLEGEVLTCQWYGAQFDVRTGESVFLRSVKPLVTYPTTVRDGRVFVEVPLAAAEAGSRWVGAKL